MADDPNTPQPFPQPFAGPGPMLFPGSGVMPQPQGAAPAPAPTGPTPAPAGSGGMDPLTQSMVAASQEGQKAYAASEARRATLAQQLQMLMAAQEAQTSAPPKYGYEPKYEKVTGGKSLLRDVGRGILQGLGGTGIGRSVESSIYGPRVKRYTEETGARAAMIQDIQKQMGTETEAQTAAAGMTAKPMTAQARIAVGEMNAQTRQAHDRMWQDVELKKQALDKDLAAGKITEAKYQADLNRTIQSAHDATAQSIAGMTTDQRDRDAQLSAFEEEYKINRENMISGALGRAVGIAPTQPSQTPTAPPGPKARGSKVAPPKTGAVEQWVRDPATGKLMRQPAAAAPAAK